MEGEANNELIIDYFQNKNNKFGLSVAWDVNLPTPGVKVLEKQKTTIDGTADNNVKISQKTHNIEIILYSKQDNVEVKNYKEM